MASIILIDDYDHFRVVMKMVLEGTGHTVRLADNGQTGLQLFREEPSEIVITDILMPGMEGVEIIKELKQISNNVKIIAISGSVERVTEAKKAGANQVLVKPVTKDKMIDTITKLVSL